MTIRAVAVAAAAATLLGAGSAQAELRSSLHATTAAFYAHMSAISPIVGSAEAIDILQRLSDDGDLLDAPDVPKGYTADEWRTYVNRIATLDLSLADQLLAQAPQALASIRGAGETLVRSSKDGTLQPLAVYVPSGYSASHAAPLVVFLHGSPQTETHVLASDYVAALADRTDSIVVAPYGRSYNDIHDATTDVYDAVDAVGHAFNIDSRKRFLAGYSTGGFSAFEVAPAHPDTWAAVMCIAGALLARDAHEVAVMLPNTRFYVLTGHNDDVLPTQYATATAAFLQSSGLAVSFYSQADGLHRLVTLLPILSQAWDDMHHGIVRSPPPALGGFELPSAPVGMGMTKP